MSENEKKSIRERFQNWRNDRKIQKDIDRRTKAANLAEKIDSPGGTIVVGLGQMIPKFGDGVEKVSEGAQEGLKQYGEALYKEDSDFYNEIINTSSRQTLSEIEMSIQRFDGVAFTPTSRADSVKVNGIQAEPQFKGLHEKFDYPKNSPKFDVDYDALNDSTLKHQIRNGDGMRYYTTSWNDMVRELRSGDLLHDEVHIVVDAPPYIYDKDNPGTSELTRYHITGDNLKTLVDEVAEKYTPFTKLPDGLIRYHDAGFKHILAGTISNIEKSYKNPHLYNDIRAESQPNIIQAYYDEYLGRMYKDKFLLDSQHKRGMFPEDQHAKFDVRRAMMKSKSEFERQRNNRLSYRDLNSESAAKATPTLQEAGDSGYLNISDDWDFEL